jgi:hypothetical protein
MTAPDLLSTRYRLNATRLRLFEAEANGLLDAIFASDSWQITAPLRSLEKDWGKTGRLIARVLKLAAWPVTGKLSRRLRFWWHFSNPARDAKEARVHLPSILPLTAPAVVLGKTILIVDERTPRPDHSAGARCTMAIMRALKAEGWSVTFWPYDRREAGEYTRQLEGLGILVIDHRFCTNFKAYLQQY